MSRRARVLRVDLHEAANDSPTRSLFAALKITCQMYGNTVQCLMIVGKFRHKGLRRLYEDDDASGVPAHSIRKIKAILAALEFADNLSQVATMPGWKLHPLKGERKGEYGITVTGNWRITFRLQANAVTDVNFEDYH